MASTDTKRDAIRGVPMFARLGDRQLEEIGRLADEVDVAAGHVLMREGAIGEEFFIILAGQVEVQRGGTVIRTLGPGDFLGEISLIDHGPRSATATCISACRLLVLAHREFNTLLADFPDIERQVLVALAERVRTLDPQAVH
jgi:CRP-like cAMP-binding protein